MTNTRPTTPEKIEKFLASVSETADITGSCRKVGISRALVYRWRSEDPEFAKAWDAAVEMGTDALEDEAVRRGREGTLKPVFYKGQSSGEIREYSDILLMFTLKGRRPWKFRDAAPPDSGDGSDKGILVKGGLPTEDVKAPPEPDFTGIEGGSGEDVDAEDVIK